MIQSALQIREVIRIIQNVEIDEQQGLAVKLAQQLPTNIANVWDAITNPERIPMWFAPVSGDLRLHGQYQVENNAGGTITGCEAPILLAVTWEFGGTISWLEVALASTGVDHTTLTLSHLFMPDEHWEEFGAGATGVGWDLGLLGLTTYLNTGVNVAEAFIGWEETPEAMDFLNDSADAWVAAEIEFGEEAEVARQKGQRTFNFYTGSGHGG